MGTVSKFHFYSLGVVAANKALTSDIIEVVAIEENQFANGEVTDNATTVTATASDTKGAAYSVSSSTTVSIKAKWLPLANSNRMTSPDVRRGETVMLYRFADTDQYYWQIWKNDMNLRKLETVIYAFSATTDEGAVTDAEHSYFFEVSTHGKYMHLHTSTANGEPYAYDIQINTDTGFIQIQDDQGNYIKFDTPAHQILIANQDGSFMEVSETNINLSCTDKISMKCTDLQIDASNSITENTTDSTLNSTSTTMNASDTTVNSSSTTVNSDSTTINSVTTNNGHVSIVGGLSVV